MYLCQGIIKIYLIMLAAAFLSCVSSSGSCITSSRKPITRIFNSELSSKSYKSTQRQQQWALIPFTVYTPNTCREAKQRSCTCECLETQWRSTFSTLLVAALRMTNSLSPFLWSVGKPEKEESKVLTQIYIHICYDRNKLSNFFIFIDK